MKIIERRPTELLEEFLKDYSELFNVSIEESKEKIKSVLRFYLTGSEESTSFDIQNYWYKSLESGMADYSCYTDKNYYIDIWCCFKLYSRKYLRIIDSKGTLTPYFLNHSIVKLLENSSSKIIDMGCGLGYSTAALAELFPWSDVYGFNIEGTEQYQFCNFLSEKYKFKLTGSYENIGDFDLVFAS